MRASFRIGWLLSFLVMGCVHGTEWRVRSEPACAAPELDPALRQERSFLALLLALEERRFTILRRNSHDSLEVELTGNNSLVQTTHWLIWLQKDGALRVDAPPYQPLQHARSPRSYDALMVAYARYRCRQQDWLRWEAQNRGLVAIGAAERAPAEVAREQAAAAHAEQLALLRRQREAIALQDPIARTVGSGMLLTLSGVALGFGGTLVHTCRAYDHDDDRACPRGRTLLTAGSVAAAASATALVFSFRRLLRDLAARRALKHEIEDLTLRGLSVSALPRGAALAAELRF